VDRFQLPFEPVEIAECDECMGSIYTEEEIEVLDDGKLVCLDCLTALEVEYEFEMEEEHEAL
jgi:formylmethanofuran dehydrogenase subunit E